MTRLSALSLGAALLCSASPVIAADAAAADAAAAGPEIIVKGERIPYGVKVTTTATKTPTDIRNVPQALTIVSSAQIEDQQIRSVGEMLLFVPGASYNSGEGSYRGPAMPVGFLDEAGNPDGLPKRQTPGLGEHTDEILASIGYAAERIADLRARKIVR